MAQPIRLVPQPAQAIEYTCPLCGGVHAAYVFGTANLRIYRCGGCGLTFSNTRTNDGPPAATAPSPDRHDRDERPHASLLEALTSESISGPVMLVADPDDELATLAGRHDIAVRRIVTQGEFGAEDWNETFSAVILSRALMRLPDPRVPLAVVLQRLGLRFPRVAGGAAGLARDVRFRALAPLVPGFRLLERVGVRRGERGDDGHR